MKKFFSFLLFIFLFNQSLFAFETSVKQAILMDYETGEVLFEKNADEKAYPSSMTKIMTAYLIFDKLENGNLSLTDEIQISPEAWKQIGSRTFLNVGSKVSIDDLLKGLIIQSGNDAAYALAEGTSGDVGEFVIDMNNKAKELQLTNTSFTNPIGFSDENHYMSVRDTAILSKELIKNHPQYYIKYFPVLEFKYNNINQLNRNQLLGKYEGVDGIKTGHTEAGGYSLAASVFRDNRRLISVVNGATSEQERTEESKRLLNYGFLALTRYVLYNSNESIKQIPVLYGKENNINIISKVAIMATAKDKDQIEIKIDLPETLKAPISKDQAVGTITIKTQSDERTYNLYPDKDIEEVNIFKRFFLSIYYFFKNLF